MPRSILLGRPWPQPGEPLFTEADTDYAIALAEEERDTCPSCGMPKAICRSPEFQFSEYEVTEETCHPTLRLAQFRDGDKWKKRHAASQQATQVGVRFREGRGPDVGYGLRLDVDVEQPPIVAG